MNESLCRGRWPGLMDVNDPEAEVAEVELAARIAELMDERCGPPVFAQGYQMPKGSVPPGSFPRGQHGYVVTSDDRISIR
ncbi:MAG: hypothetical protein ACLP4W_15520 [Mycobacterium sp.]|uniref:hypothetical protein n=1 Tax=Mycobacterium sp. TaxID=1785 RepID=UPI003F9C2A4C